MDRSSPDEGLTETIKALIISRKASVTVAQLQSDYEQVEGCKIPELKLQSALKYNPVFHCIKPINGQEERWDIRFDVKARMNRQKALKKFSQATVPRTMKNPEIPRNRWTSNNNNNHFQKNYNTSDSEPLPLSDLRQKLNRKEPAPLLKLTMPLSERLKKKGELSPQDILAANVVKDPEVWHATLSTNFNKLMKYCELQKIPKPELKFLKNPLAKNTFRCQVTVRDKTYMAYNDSFATEAEAQEACCRVAVNEIRYEEQLALNPLDISNDFEILRKIWMMIRSSIGGVFIKHIAELYIDTYKLSPPENWHQIVKQYDEQLFNFEVNALNKEPIIFATGDIDSFTNGPNMQAPNETIQRIPELEYPWNDKLWNVFVTSAFSTNEICARLIGPDHSGAVDKLLNDIEIFMMGDKERPTEVKCNQIYLTSIAECWHRIRVVETNGYQAHCICIDNGEFEWISIQEIFICQPEFLSVAPQAIKLSLFGLEDFENDPNVSQQLFEPLVFKSLIGEVMIDKTDFQKNKSEAIKIILYDTSTDDDVNLNESIMSSILKSIPAPSLHQKDNNQVIITHIADDAIYCQLLKSSYYIQQLINKLPKIDIAKHRGMYIDKADKKRIYLVYDPKLKNWFRARLERLIDGNIHMMSYVDYGIKAMVKVEDIYRLDKLSFVLYFYPPQVIKFGLFNVQLTDDVRKRLMALLPSGRKALVKVVTMGTGSFPLVHLFTHINHNDETIMIKINDQFTSMLGVTELQSFSPNEPLIKLEQRQLKNEGKFMKVYVTLVSSPRCFVFQLEDDLLEFETMLNELQSHCANNGKLLFSDIKKSECYAIYDEDDRKWIRASAENVIDQNCIHCLCVDSGNFKTLSINNVRSLPNQFRKLPKQALKARLYGVKPKYTDFTPDDAIHFKMLTENKTFPAVIKNITTDPFEKQEIYEIVLFGKDEKIHEILIKEKRALAI